MGEQTDYWETTLGEIIALAETGDEGVQQMISEIVQGSGFQEMIRALRDLYWEVNAADPDTTVSVSIIVTNRRLNKQTTIKGQLTDAETWLQLRKALEDFPKGQPGRPPGISGERLERIEKVGRLKTEGLTLDQIAERLAISSDTAKKDWREFKHLFDKK